MTRQVSHGGWSQGLLHLHLEWSRDGLSLGRCGKRPNLLVVVGVWDTGKAHAHSGKFTWVPRSSSAPTGSGIPETFLLDEVGEGSQSYLCLPSYLMCHLSTDSPSCFTGFPVSKLSVVFGQAARLGRWGLCNRWLRKSENSGYLITVGSFMHIFGKSPNLVVWVSENENFLLLLLILSLSSVMRVINKLMYVKILCETLFITVMAK